MEFYLCNFSERQRNLPELTKEEVYYAEAEAKKFLEKWVEYNSQFTSEHKIIEAALTQQEKALEALKQESKELYNMALEASTSSGKLLNTV